RTRPSSPLRPYTTLFRSCRSCGVHDPCQSSNQEHEDKANSEQHRSLKADPTTPQGSYPIEDLHAGRYRNSHGQQAECCCSSQSQDRKSTRLNSSHVKISY